MAKKLTKTKARQILHDKEVHGQPLTEKQRKFFGAIAGGAKPYKAQNGIEGTMGGLTDKGFNFNPAWGGAWKHGGLLKKAQGGGKIKDPDKKWIEAAATKHQKCGIGSEDPDCVVGAVPQFPGMPTYENMSNPENLWNWPESKKEQRAFMSNIDARYKMLSQQYPNLTKEALVAAMRDSTRTNPLLANPAYTREFDERGKLKDSTMRIEPFLKYWRGAYPEKTKITVPDILQNLGQNIANYSNLINTGYRRFQDGGNLPGSVGFMYARTQGAAPSEGPYAKKTLPSAQNGMEMKYYQEGLDFKPKTISRNGGWLDKYDVPKAQFGNISSMITGVADLGEGLSEILSFPQKGIVKLITGKYQTPAEAMGVKSGVGSFLVNAALDPFTLIGAGVTGKVAKSAVKASKESGALSKAYKLNPWAFKPNPRAAYRMIGEEGYADALESGIIRAKPSAGKLNIKTGKIEYGSPNFEHPYFSYGKPWDKDLVKGKPWMGYKGPYMVELTNEPSLIANDLAYSTGKNNIYRPTRIIESNEPNVKFYREHWLKGYKEVPKPKKKEKGGGIKKDDMGYWNPENWGKVVEIDSPYITMKGVDVPLIGVSDTGDVQYMEPGEDYVFDGESVTEYPVAAQGVSVNRADEYPLKKLDDLFNFTNYNKPTKGGWLDRYEN